MKKLISSLMIGLIATTATMSAMAAPAQDHRNPPPAAKFDKKPMPPKAAAHKAPSKAHIKHDAKHAKFDKKPVKHIVKHDTKHPPMVAHKAPPKHR